MAIRSTHKGDRAQLGPRVDRVVYDAVAAHSGQYGGDGIPMSQWVADLLAAIVGHPELMRELDGEDVAQIFARALDNPDLLRGRARLIRRRAPHATAAMTTDEHAGVARYRYTTAGTVSVTIRAPISSVTSVIAAYSSSAGGGP